MQCHIESLRSLSQLKESFKNMGVVRAQNHGEEVIRGYCFIFKKTRGEEFKSEGALVEISRAQKIN